MSKLGMYKCKNKNISISISFEYKVSKLGKYNVPAAWHDAPSKPHPTAYQVWHQPRLNKGVNNKDYQPL